MRSLLLLAILSVSFLACSRTSQQPITLASTENCTWRQMLDFVGGDLGSPTHVSVGPALGNQPAIVWLVTFDGRVYQRTGIDGGNSAGTGWQLVPSNRKMAMVSVGGWERTSNLDVLSGYHQVVWGILSDNPNDLNSDPSDPLSYAILNSNKPICYFDDISLHDWVCDGPSTQFGNWRWVDAKLAGQSPVMQATDDSSTIFTKAIGNENANADWATDNSPGGCLDPDSACPYIYELAVGPSDGTSTTSYFIDSDGNFWSYLWADDLSAFDPPKQLGSANRVAASASDNTAVAIGTDQKLFSVDGTDYNFSIVNANFNLISVSVADKNNLWAVSSDGYIFACTP